MTGSGSRIQEFEDVFQYIGGFGPYQYIWFFIACFINWTIGFAHFGQLFMTLTPPHHCNIDLEKDALTPLAVEFNFTQNQILNMMIPPLRSGQGRDSCSMYDVNFTQAILDGHIDPNISWPVKKCTNGWTYDFSYYYPSITSQLDWVCDDDWRPPMSQTVFFIGSLIGIPLFGWMADTFGRLPIAVSTNVLGGLFGLASSFANNFVVFCILRFLVGLTYDSFYMVTFILAMEYVGTSYRTLICILPPTLFLTASLCSAPWIAYYLHDWTLFGVAISTPQILFIFLPFILHDSVRWLISNGKVEKSIDIVKSVAKINGKKITDEFTQKFQIFAEEQQKKSERKVSWYHLFKTPQLRKRIIICSIMWVAVMVAFDGFMRNAEKIKADFFMTFTWMGLCELPADFLIILLMEKVGRKHTTVWSLVCCGFVALSVALIEESQTNLIVGISIAGRFLATMAITVGIQYIVEVLPTEGRAQGSGVVHTVGIGMSFISPYIVYMGKYRHWAPFVAFGVICIVCGGLCVLLPETMGENLPDTLEEGEEAFKNQPLFYNPCLRKRKVVDESPGDKGEVNPSFVPEDEKCQKV